MRNSFCFGFNFSFAVAQDFLSIAARLSAPGIIVAWDASYDVPQFVQKDRDPRFVGIAVVDADREAATGYARDSPDRAVKRRAVDKKRAVTVDKNEGISSRRRANLGRPRLLIKKVAQIISDGAHTRIAGGVQSEM